MATTETLQDPIEVSANTAEDPENALPMGDSDTLVLECLVPGTANAGTTLTIEHAAVRVESAFVSTGVTFDLGAGAAAAQVDVAEGLLQFVRWSVSGWTSGTATFALYAVKRP